MNDLPLRPAADIGAVEDRFFTLRNFPLADGTVIPKATIAYETYGRPVFDGRNAILCTHGCRRRMCHAGIAQSRIGRAPPSGTAAFALKLFGSQRAMRRFPCDGLDCCLIVFRAITFFLVSASRLIARNEKGARTEPTRRPIAPAPDRGRST